ncbi:MAG: Gfo/Idh/MocA family oxidoreductase [Melioribacteraceae bacterium]|nr:Gfo/Idh/MocA family oxidoreductase [Melioribacteraceae bacterium]
MSPNFTRRDFIKSTAIVSTGLAMGAGSLSAKNYSRIMGANDRVNFGVIGLHGRGSAHIDAIATCSNAAVSSICDVDRRELDKSKLKVEKKFGKSPKLEKDIRILLEDKDVDAITIATPEHWHTPMTLMGLQAGKHVYLEKPCSHNPAEGIMLINAQANSKFLIQMGNQQRSSVHTIEAMKKIKEGVLGEVYSGKAWYSNNRKAIGIGKVVPVPEYLDWELWQGPAPRVAYKDIYHPYNWHWFWHWGTGETLNNGTHEVDLCLWALGMEYPKKVTASGGRYHFKDDWEFYDTLSTSYEYDNKMITWEGRSCNSLPHYGRGRGASIHGTEGSMIIDRDGYEIYNKNSERIFDYKKSEFEESMGTVGGGEMTDKHFNNFVNAIRIGEKLNSPINEGNKSVTMLQLSNIAWKVGRTLNLDTSTGRIQNDKEADKMWQREYEPGWEPKI